jgi:hypothetical protein
LGREQKEVSVEVEDGGGFEDVGEREEHDCASPPTTAVFCDSPPPPLTATATSALALSFEWVSWKGFAIVGVGPQGRWGAGERGGARARRLSGIAMGQG